MRGENIAISHLSERVCCLIIGQYGTRFSQGDQARSQVHTGAVHVTAVSQNFTPDEGDTCIRQLRVGTNLFGELQADFCDGVRGFGEEENFVTESLNNATAQGCNNVQATLLKVVDELRKSRRV